MGAVVMTSVYFKSRERQMLIERGLSAEEVKQYFMGSERRNKYLMAQIGVILIFFGIGVGLGMFLEDITDRDYWMVLLIFTVTGLGFILANMVPQMMGKEARG